MGQLITSAYDSTDDPNLKWEHCIKEIFPSGIPQYCEWTDNGSITRILNILGKNTDNHLFFPTGEGLELTGAEPSDEFGCIELFFGRVPHIVKPDRLIFQNIRPADLKWSYFFLESKKIAPSGVYEKLFIPREELVKLPDGKLLARMHWDEGFMFDENGQHADLPEDSKLIVRCLSGNYPVLSKGSFYDELAFAYSGSCADEFKSGIDALYERVSMPELV